MEFAVRDGVIANLCGGQVAHLLLVLKLVQTETITTFATVVVVLDVGNHTVTHLQLYVLCGGDTFFVLVHGLKILADDGTVRDDVGTEIVGHQRDEDA